jgi:very-short-patch-repair endonuclease
VPFRNYILDFVCFERRIVIEVDGSQHFESRPDKVRDRVLEEAGFRTLRYWNIEVLKQPKVVLEDIYARLSETEAS